PAQRSLFGLYFGQLVIAVLGAVTITSEYATDMIRTSLTAMPRRGTMFAAKAVVFAAVALVTGLICSFGAFFTGQALMSGQHINATLGQPHVLRAVVGGALFLAACGMLAYGIGAILRHTAGAITASIVLLFVVSILVNALPGSWQDHVDKWVPAIAGSQIWAVKASGGNPPMFAPWTGFAVFCGYAAIAMIAGLILSRRRDAYPARLEPQEPQGGSAPGSHPRRAAPGRMTTTGKPQMVVVTASTVPSCDMKRSMTGCSRGWRGARKAGSPAAEAGSPLAGGPKVPSGRVAGP